MEEEIVLLKEALRTLQEPHAVVEVRSDLVDAPLKAIVKWVRIGGISTELFMYESGLFTVINDTEGTFIEFLGTPLSSLKVTLE